MFPTRLLSFLILCLVSVQSIRKSEYVRMPPVFHLDDYDRCMLHENGGLYCSIVFELSNNGRKNGSDIWQIIQEVNASPKNYRHDLLRYGVCLPETCKSIPSTLYETGNVSERLKDAIEKCYDGKFRDDGLKTKIAKIHCENAEDVYNVDLYDWIFAICLMIILSLVLASTLGKSCSAKSSQYEDILSYFALQNNWKTLTNTSSSAHLTYIEGIRSLNSLLVVVGHTSMALVATPVANTWIAEKTLDDPMSMPMINGPILVQTNLVLSGWLLSWAIFRAAENGVASSLKNYLRILIYRYLRLTPVLVCCLWFWSTWARHVSRGPFYAWNVGEEFQRCRSNWWTNVLYINNLIDCSQMCLATTWYMAVDMQLFAASLVVLYIANKNPLYTFQILLISVAIGLTIPAIVVYTNNLDIILRAYPERAYVLMLPVKLWHQLKIPSYMNAGCYFQGLLFGYAFNKYKNCSFVPNKILKTLWILLTVSVVLAVLFLPFVFYNGYQHSRLEAALYNSLSVNLFGFVMGLLILGMAFGNFVKLRQFFEMRIFQVLGKLSFSMYVSHPVHMRLRMGITRKPVDLIPDTMITTTCGDILISLIVGVIVYLFIEMPFKNLTDHYLRSKRPTIGAVEKPKDK